ncbi:hypothetical protein [Shinella sp. BYT-45]|uniref:hypothetical protein n=1 Tax=Shinella sp. BYT-45 TaxID=3377377 RepID=UPI0039809388
MGILFQGAVAVVFSMVLLVLLLLFWPRREGLRRMLGSGSAGGSSVGAYGASTDGCSGQDGGGGDC